MSHGIYSWCLLVTEEWLRLSQCIHTDPSSCLEVMTAQSESGVWKHVMKLICKTWKILFRFFPQKNE